MLTLNWSQFSVTERTPELASAAGITTLLDFVDDDVPYVLAHGGTGARVLCLPYCMETNDFSLVLTRHHTARQYAAAIEDHVTQLATETGRPETAVVCLGMHTFVAGTPGHAKALAATLRRLKDCPGVVFSTASQIQTAAMKNQTIKGESAFGPACVHDHEASSEHKIKSFG